METINNILHEMRSLGRLDEESTDKIPRSLQALGLLTYADRIEKAITNCNQLKMREALELVRLYISNGPEEESRAYVKNGQIEMLFALEVLDTISAALSATPRNCDMFSDETEAQLKFLNDVWLVSSDKESMLERHRIENWTEEMLLRYARWLLAPVKKGENDEE